MPSSSTIVLITGANSGVGYATAKVIASASPNYHVIITSRSPSNGSTALSSLQASPSIKGTLSLLQLDVTSPESVSAAAAHVSTQHGRLDVLINNAGMFFDETGMSSDAKLDALKTTFETNVLGAARVAEAFKPLLKKSKRAYLVHVSSGLGSIARAHDESIRSYRLPNTAYRMSKAALNMVMVEDKKELEEFGVKVFAVCPGLVVSNLRGKGESQRSAGGVAEDPEISGQLFLDIIEGKRDADVGKFVKKDGLHPW